MTPTEAARVEQEWTDLVLWGTVEQIDRLVAEVDEWVQTGVVLGWHRNTESEAAIWQGWYQRTRCYNRRLPSHGEPALWLLLPSGRRVIGGPVAAIDRRWTATGVVPVDATEYRVEVAETIESFRTNVLAPVVRRVGVATLSGRVGPRSHLARPVSDALWEVVEAGPGCWDADYSVARKWRDFVLAVNTSGALFDPGELCSWLGRAGWAPAEASALLSRFTADAALLSEYEDRRQTA